MAAIINNGGDGATGTHAATGITEIIASGSFGTASVEILLSHDGQAAAPVWNFSAPGAISLQCAGGATITAKVRGTTGQTPVIDVTCNP